jgi:hypothetical protein
MIGVALLIIDAFLVKIRYRQTSQAQPNYTYFLIVLFTIYIIFSAFIGSYHNDLNIKISRAAFCFYSIILLFCLYVYYSTNIEFLNKPLTNVLCIHLLFFYFQLIVVGIFSIELDLIAPITGEAQRIFGGSYDVGLFSQFFRPAGLFAEPGTYANMVFLIFVIREVVRSNGQRYTIEKTTDIAITALVIVSMILSFSIFAYIFIAIFVLSSFLKSNSKGKTAVLLFLIIFPFFSIVLIYLQQRFALGDASGTGFRYEAMLILFDQLDWMNLLIGWGFLSEYSNLYYDVTFNDLGLLFNIILQCGLVGVLIWAGLFSRFVRFNAPELALAILLQLTKFTLTYPIIWLALILILNAARRRVDNVRAHQSASSQDRV